MNDEDKIWFSGIFPYFRMLKRINELLILLISNNPNMEEQEDNFLDLTTELLRILPFKLIKDVDTKEVTGIELLKKDGILLLKEYFNDLEKDYNDIINNNFIELVQIIKIRNKFVHEPHNIKCVCFSCGGKHAYVGFEYKEEYLELNTDYLIEIIKELNIVFEKIKIKFESKVSELDEKDKEHPYILNLFNNYFENYNSNL